MKTLSLCTFIDAFGWEILKQNSFLDDVLITKEPLDTIFGYSSTCDPTILTGKLPRDHGHFSFFAYDPKVSPFHLCTLLKFFPKSITRRGRVRRIMSRLIKRIYGYTGYFQIYNMPFDKIAQFDYTEKKDLYEHGGINSGVPTIFDYIRENKIPFYKSDWQACEEKNLDVLEKEIKKGEIKFAYLYMAAMDATLHQYGAQSKEGKEKIKWYEKQMRRILKVANEEYDSVNLFVFSDHGMTDTIEEYPLMDSINKLDLRFGVDYAVVYDSTMARFWFLNEKGKTEIINALEKENCGKILSKDEMHRYGCDFPNKRYGDLFFLMNPGILLNPSYMGESHMEGMHGYSPDHKDSIAMFASNIKPDPMPKRLDDLYDLMMNELK